MNDLKFRAKELNTGLWVKGFFVSFLDIAVSGSPRVNAVIDDRGHWSYVDPETVGQLWEPSHGLKVYTGDLLLAECSPSGSNETMLRITKMDFGAGGFSAAVWHEGEWWAPGYFKWTTAKIIGNIYENPELLTTPTHG